MKRKLIITAAVLLFGTSPLFAQDAVVIEVPQPARDYVIANPTEPIVVEQDLTMGTVVPDDIQLVPIPDSPDYSYVYVDKRPIIVSTKDRKVMYLSD